MIKKVSRLVLSLLIKLTAFLTFVTLLFYVIVVITLAFSEFVPQSNDKAWLLFTAIFGIALPQFTISLFLTPYMKKVSEAINKLVYR